MTHSLRDLVTAAARRTPEAVAIEDHRGATTYAELNTLADQLAHALRTAGVGEGDRVGIWAAKSARTVAAMQATLRLGAAYIPLDPKSPVSRIDQIARSAEVAAVVVDADRPCAELTVPAPTVSLDAERTEPGTPLALGAPSDDDLAYILFTSGSTGTPKGVSITQRNALAFVDWAHDTVRATSADRFSSHAPFHFDLSVLDLYAAFRAGATVCLVPDGIAYAPRRLARFVADHRITVWYSVPSALSLMTQHGGLLDIPTPDLRVVLFAGEPYPVKHLRALRESRPGVRLLNLYGPTETNVCTAYEVVDLDPERTTPVPIGTATCGDRVWAETDDGTEADVGQIGELVVEGPTVMRGYWGRPPQDGPYRTGDLVRRLEGGDYEYVGRRDRMVKVRGHRIELGEIEAALLRHPGIDAACVVVRGEGMDATLVAWVVPSEGRGPGLLDIKRHCAGSLPAYMIVGELRTIPRLPTTRNGKVDRAKLQRDAA